MRCLLLFCLAGWAVVAGPPEPARAAEGSSLAGKLLVARPEMRDPRFAHAVIYLCRQATDGAFGLIINRPLGEVPGATVAQEFGLDAEPGPDPIALFWGGPVELQRGFVLHTTDYLLDTSNTVANGIAYSTDARALVDVIEGHGAAHSLLALGYAGWAANQLEGELAHNAWDVVDADAEFVFGTRAEDMWQAALDRVSVDL